MEKKDTVRKTSYAQREMAKNHYETARKDLWVLLALTLINLVAVSFGVDTMALFSLYIPYVVMVVGIQFRVLSSGLFFGCIAIVVFIMLIFLLCAIFSKKHIGWMIVGTVLLIIDTIAMGIWGIMIPEIVMTSIWGVGIHIGILTILIAGIRSKMKLKNIPEEEAVPEQPAASNLEIQNSSILRIADNNVKFRVLLEKDVWGHHVCYRRVKRVNELVIDGYVYDEVEMLMEKAHELTANRDGHVFVVGFDGVSSSYMYVDNIEVAKKARLW